jgi:hypothetical protein
MTTKPTETKSTAPNALAAKAPALAAKAPKEPTMTLKAICAELKLDPRLSREKLRIAARDAKKFPELAKAHKPRSSWEWLKGSPAEKEARTALLA